MTDDRELDIGDVALLARINLTPEEADLFQKQLGDVLNYVRTLQEVDTTGVETAAHSVPLFNVFREDESRPWFTPEQALANAPRKANDLFLVTKVVE